MGDFIDFGLNAETAALFLGLGALVVAFVAVWLAASGRRWRGEAASNSIESLQRREQQVMAAERRDWTTGSATPAGAAIPERRPEADSAPAAEPPRRQELGQGKTILIADDDPDITHAFALRLKEMGFETIRSPDAMHALLGVHRMRPDLVIMDVRMPSGNGLAVCEMLGHDKRCAGIPVIVLTGLSDAATIRRCEEIGAHYVFKSPDAWADVKALLPTLLHLDSNQPADGRAGTEQASSDGSQGNARPNGRRRKRRRR